MCEYVCVCVCLCVYVYVFACVCLSVCVIDAAQGVYETNKKSKYGLVFKCSSMSSVTNVSNEEVWKTRGLCQCLTRIDPDLGGKASSIYILSVFVCVGGWVGGCGWV